MSSHHPFHSLQSQHGLLTKTLTQLRQRVILKMMQADYKPQSETLKALRLLQIVLMLSQVLQLLLQLMNRFTCEYYTLVLLLILIKGLKCSHSLPEMDEEIYEDAVTKAQHQIKEVRLQLLDMSDEVTLPFSYQLYTPDYEDVSFGSHSGWICHKTKLFSRFLGQKAQIEQQTTHLYLSIPNPTQSGPIGTMGPV